MLYLTLQLTTVSKVPEHTLNVLKKKSNVMNNDRKANIRFISTSLLINVITMLLFSERLSIVMSGTVAAITDEVRFSDDTENNGESIG